jgi:hypothetical protein
MHGWFRVAERKRGHEGTTAACTLRLTQLALDGNSECGIMGDAWLGSLKSAVALLKK